MKAGSPKWRSGAASRKRRRRAPVIGSGCPGREQQTLVVVRDSNDQPDRSAGAQQVLDVLQKTIK